MICPPTSWLKTHIVVGCNASTCAAAARRLPERLITALPVELVMPAHQEQVTSISMKPQLQCNQTIAVHVTRCTHASYPTRLMKTLQMTIPECKSKQCLPAAGEAFPDTGRVWPLLIGAWLAGAAALAAAAAALPVARDEQPLGGACCHAEAPAERGELLWRPRLLTSPLLESTHNAANATLVVVACSDCISRCCICCKHPCRFPFPPFHSRGLQCAPSPGGK